MSDLSTLLLLTCATCTNTTLSPAPTDKTICTQTQEQSQGNQPVAGSPCISPPEATLSQSGFRTTKTFTEKSAPRPAPPELFASLPDAAINDQQTSPPPSPTPLLRTGNQGEAVTQLQKTLQQLGYYQGTVDGIYGQLTKTAVSKFQQAKELKVDGIVGPQTWTALQALPAVPKPASQRKPGSADVPKPASQRELGSADVPKPASQGEPGSAEPSDGETLNPPPPQKAPRPASTLQTFTSESENLWFLGWAVVFTGGLVFILKNCVDDLKGYKIIKGSIRGKRVDAIASGDPSETQDSNSAVASSDIVKSEAVDLVTEPPDLLHFLEKPYSSPIISQKQLQGLITSATQSGVSSYYQTTTLGDASNKFRYLIPPDLTMGFSGIGQGSPLHLQTLFAGRSGKIYSIDRTAFAKLNGSSSPRSGTRSGNYLIDQEAVPAMSLELDRQLVAFWAHGGSVEPLKGLFLDPDIPVDTALPKHQKVNTTVPTNDAVETRVAEDGPAGTLIGTLPLSNPKTRDTYTYSLIDDAGGRFILTGNELRLADRVLLTFQDDASHNIIVRCTNNRGFSVDKSFTVTLSSDSVG